MEEKERMSYAMALSRARGKSAAMTERAIRTLEVAGAAGAVSAASVRYGGPQGYQIGGFPVELVAGAALALAAIMDAGGPRFSGDLMNLSDGCFAAFAAMQGRAYGARGAKAGAGLYEIGQGGLTPEAVALLRAAGLPVPE
jgi:hypothetical protein